MSWDIIVEKRGHSGIKCFSNVILFIMLYFAQRNETYRVQFPIIQLYLS